MPQALIFDPSAGPGLCGPGPASIFTGTAPRLSRGLHPATPAADIGTMGRPTTTRARLTHGDDSGFTLVEVIVAMMVFATIATALGYTAMGALRASNISRAEQQAIDFATQKLEALRAVRLRLARSRPGHGHCGGLAHQELHRTQRYQPQTCVVDRSDVGYHQ